MKQACVAHRPSAKRVIFFCWQPTQLQLRKSVVWVMISLSLFALGWKRSFTCVGQTTGKENDNI